MAIDAILFDLDGTLLPMSEKKFLYDYLENFALFCTRIGFDPDIMTKSLLYGMQKMMQSTGGTNEQRFWDACFEKAGMSRLSDRSVFTDFYRFEFLNVKKSVSPTPLAAECIKAAKAKQRKVILATNPIFPQIATLKRIEWAGLNAEDFEIITTYEDYSFTKPDPEYYHSVLAKAQLDPKNCVMIGNDVCEDMCTEKLGMKTFLITDCIINRNDDDISRFQSGSIADCLEFIKSL